jgi:hypothetical protein
MRRSIHILCHYERSSRVFPQRQSGLLRRKGFSQ